MKNILITGSSGFVGKNLINFFKKYEYQISIYNRKSELDIKTVSAIIHLAGKAHDLKNVSEPKEYYDANFELTKKIYDEFLSSNAEIFIFISSVKASADKVDGVLLESDVPNPKTHYGKSKLLAEDYIKSQALPAEKKYFILRPCMIHGPGNKGNLNLLYKVVSKGIPWPLASFENKRSFLSVENLSFVINELIVRDDIDSGVYNIADDRSISTNELISIISKSLNRKPMLWHLNSGLIKGIAKIGDKLRLPLNTERLTKLTESYVVSNEKIKKAIGKAFPLTTEDGLDLTLTSFRKDA